MKQLLLSILFIIGFAGLGFSQATIKGFFREISTEPVVNALVQVGEQTTETDENGFFQLELEDHGDNLVLFITKGEFDDFRQEFSIAAGQVLDFGNLEATTIISNTSEATEDRISTITLLSDEIETGGQDNQNISGVLSASRDVFINAAAYTFGNARFRIRGYDSENSTVLLNGVPINELENGGVYWGAWGGLNDVTRNRRNSFGLTASPYAFGGVGGSASIDLRASNHRQQTRFDYAISNRTYRQRAMLTYSTGLLDNGWAFSLSGSKRWADEGYIVATSYDAYSYFLSVDKKIGKNSSLNFVALGAPSERGRATTAIEEVTELTNNNYYNPYWGFQDGEKRNARVRKSHQPIFMLRHDWDMGDNANLTTAISYQFGRNGSTNLDWFEAADPRPDYYRNLPSYFAREFPENPELAENLAAQLSANPELLQLDWNSFYEANSNNDLAVENINGTNNSIQGRFAQYKLIDERYDSKEFNANIIYENILTDNFTLHTGLTVQKHKTENFREIVDLLGGDFFVDWDRFSARDFGGDYLDNDLNNPNNVVREGDKFGYHYDGHIYKHEAWAQGELSFNKIDFFAGINFSETVMWRDGQFRNGRFPTRSEGVSAKKHFTNGAVKGGATYKIDARNYLYVNGMYMTRAPFFRNAYISPRTRQDLVPDLTSEKITSVEGGYLLRGVNLKGRLSGYLTNFEDETRVIRFFTDVDLESEFINYILTDIDTRNVGLEFAVEAKINPTLSLTAVAAYGQYFHTNRPTRLLFNDVDAASTDFADKKETVYIKNFRQSGTPQQAYTFGINYNPKPLYLLGGQQRVFMNLNFNYFDDIYLDFSPERRTADAVDGVAPNSELWNQIINQEQLPSAFTMDFFGGISFSRKLRMNIGVNNLLDKTDFRTGGYEQLRFDLGTKDTNEFPPRYFLQLRSKLFYQHQLYIVKIKS